MKDMFALEKKGDAAGLAPYLESLLLPNPEAWFEAEFRTVNCGSDQMGADDCLGPRMALRYTQKEKVFAASFTMTLHDLLHEPLPNFEAVDYDAICPGPQRIVPAKILEQGFHVTLVLSSGYSGLVDHHEPVYVVWCYSETEETTLYFFIYSEGAFRYLGQPQPAHPAELKHQADETSTNGGTASPSAPALAPQILTDEDVPLTPVLVDPAVIARTVVLIVTLGSDGVPIEATYVRGPEDLKDAAIRAVMDHRFDFPMMGLGKPGLHSQACIDVPVESN